MYRLTDKGRRYFLELIDFRNVGKLNFQETTDKIVMDLLGSGKYSALSLLTSYSGSYGGVFLDSFERLLDGGYIEEVD